MKNKIVLASTVLALLVGFAQTVHARLAIRHFNIVEIHLPGSEKGKKFGAVSFTDPGEEKENFRQGKGKIDGEFKPTVFTMTLSESIPITTQGKDGLVKIALKDLRPGLLVRTHIGIERPSGAQKLMYIHAPELPKGK